MNFKLKELPYSMEALEPKISSKTIGYHYGKHHQTYVNNLNNLVKGTEFENADLETIIKKSDGGIFNNGAQVWNHTFYWESMNPHAKSTPDGELLSMINQNFGSFDQFEAQFKNACLTLFGSGWVWLVKNDKGALEITKESNAGNPLRQNYIPLLTCDVWEHAYYLDYQNQRPVYVEEFWKLIDWQKVVDRL